MTQDTDTRPENAAAPQLAYIKRLDDEAIYRLVEPNALEQVADPDDLFAVYGADGQPLAVIEGRDAAFAAARQHALTPVSVH